MKHQCTALGLNQPLWTLNQEQIQDGDFMVDDFHRVILKSVQKTGCTSWKSLVIESSPVKNASHIEPFQRIRYPEVGLAVLDDNVLRVALYKLENYFNILTVRHPLRRLESYFSRNMLDKKIFKKHRGISVTLVMEHFENFIHRVLYKKNQNIHWNPIYDHSYPCTINYR